MAPYLSLNIERLIYFSNKRNLHLKKMIFCSLLFLACCSGAILYPILDSEVSKVDSASNLLFSYP